MAISRLKKNPIVVLIATLPRIDELLHHSLIAIASQTLQPDSVVIVADKRSFTIIEQQMLQSVLPHTSIIFLTNNQATGAAGAWNTGIAYLKSNNDPCFVAILDDDDSWTADHLQLCAQNAAMGKFELVLSGMAIMSNGKVIAQNNPRSLKAEDFLTGNPGWQGSNTFISLSLLDQAGRFSNGMLSCNDRDLAIRVLDLAPQIAFTNRVTVSWQINHRDDALSAARSPQKLIGLSQFYRKYQNRMSEFHKEVFFDRIERLFKWRREEVEDEVRSLRVEHRYANNSKPGNSNQSQSAHATIEPSAIQ